MVIKEKKEVDLSPIKIIVLSFLVIILMGTVLLSLPMSPKSGTELVILMHYLRRLVPRVLQV